MMPIHECNWPRHNAHDATSAADGGGGRTFNNFARGVTAANA